MVDTPSEENFLEPESSGESVTPVVVSSTQNTAGSSLGRQTDRLSHGLMVVAATLSIVMLGSFLGIAVLIAEMREMIMPKEIQHYIARAETLAPDVANMTMCTHDLEKDVDVFENFTLEQYTYRNKTRIETNAQEVAVNDLNVTVELEEERDRDTGGGIKLYMFKNTISKPVYFTRGVLENAGDDFPYFFGPKDVWFDQTITEIGATFKCPTKGWEDGNCCQKLVCFDTDDITIQNEYFECTVPGYYMFELHAWRYVGSHKQGVLGLNPDAYKLVLDIVHITNTANGLKEIPTVGVYVPNKDDFLMGTSNSVVLKLKKGDQVHVFFQQTDRTSAGAVLGPSKGITESTSVTTFTGLLLFQTD